MAHARILIDVPNPQRDLLALTHLKIRLEDAGFDVRLVEGTANGLWTILTFRPHAVVLAQVSEIHGSSLAKYAKAIGSKVIVLRTEGVIGERDIPTLTSTRFVGSYDAATDADLVWGPQFKDALVKNTDMPASKVHVVGNPRFDFYKPPLSSFFMTKSELCEKYGLQPEKPLVGYTSNLVFADLVLKTVKGNDNYLDDYGWLAYEREKHIRQRDTATDAFLKLAKSHPKINFALKLHPWEDTQYYADRLGKKPGNLVILDKDELIGNVVKNVDALVQINSTTATEAWAFQKPVITMAFFRQYDAEFGEFIRGCQKTRDIGQLETALANALKDRHIPESLQKHRDAFIRRWYHAFDGHSTERAAAIIARALKHPPTLAHVPKDAAKVLSLAAKIDVPASVRQAIYANGFLRNAYLKLRWKRTKEARRMMDKAYDQAFHKRARAVERHMRELLRSTGFRKEKMRSTPPRLA